MSGILPLCDQLVKQAQEYCKYARHDLAVGVLRQAAGFARNASQFRQVQTALADSYTRLGRFRLARKHLKVALSDCPNDAELHARLGKAWDQDAWSGDTAQALRHLRKAVALDPTQPNHQRDLGRALLGAGRIAAGLRRLEQAWTLAPDEFARLEELIDAYLEYGRLLKAERVLTRARFRLWRVPGFSALEQRVRHARLARRQRQQRWRGVAGAPVPAVLPLLRVRMPQDPPPAGRPCKGVILRMDAKSPDQPRRARRTKSRQRISD
jgi:tetratricopeptide (TPR) repeat protein